MNERIFVIEDDENIQEIVKLSLESNGYQVTLFDNAIDAIIEIKREAPDLAIFDVMLPQMDGISAVKKIRETNTEMPILILSAKDSEIDKIHGLDSGSDDYMTKPIDLEELLMRIKALLRRYSIKNNHKLNIGDVELDYDKLSVTKNEESIYLPKKEFYLLYKLLSYPGKIFTRMELMDDIWGMDSCSEEQTVNVHIRRLREKFKEYSEFEIITVRGLGYKVEKKV